jgi:uncharacterized membrane protein
VGIVERSVTIPAAADEVWDVLADVRLLPSISRSTVAVDAPERLDRRGQQFTQTVELGGRRFTSTWTVQDVEPGRRLVIEGSVLPGTRYRMAEELTAGVGPDGRTSTRLSLVMDYRLPLGPLGRLAGRLGAERAAVAEAEEVLDGVRRAVEERAGDRS